MDIKEKIHAVFTFVVASLLTAHSLLDGVATSDAAPCVGRAWKTREILIGYFTVEGVRNLAEFNPLCGCPKAACSVCICSFFVHFQSRYLRLHAILPLFLSTGLNARMHAFHCPLFLRLCTCSCVGPSLPIMKEATLFAFAMGAFVSIFPFLTFFNQTRVSALTLRCVY